MDAPPDSLEKGAKPVRPVDGSRRSSPAVAVGPSFDDWYREEHPRLLAAMTLVAADPDLAREATDEAFLRAFERWSRVSAMTTPGGWLYRTARNIVRRRWRRAAFERRILERERPAIEAPPSLDPAVWDVVARLPERQRTAIALRYLMGMSQAEVADAMGVAVGTASASLTAARKALEPHLGPNPDVPSPDAIAATERRSPRRLPSTVALSEESIHE